MSPSFSQSHDIQTVNPEAESPQLLAMKNPHPAMRMNGANLRKLRKNIVFLFATSPRLKFISLAIVSNISTKKVV